MSSQDSYIRKKEALAEGFRAGSGPVGLQKETSNLFRDRAGGARRRLDVRGFNEVLLVGKDFVDAEGMTPYETLVDACLAQGVMPAVVPALPPARGTDRESTRLNSSHA